MNKHIPIPLEPDAVRLLLTLLKEHATKTMGAGREVDDLTYNAALRLIGGLAIFDKRPSDNDLTFWSITKD